MIFFMGLVYSDTWLLSIQIWAQGNRDRPKSWNTLVRAHVHELPLGSNCQWRRLCPVWSSQTKLRYESWCRRMALSLKRSDTWQFGHWSHVRIRKSPYFRMTKSKNERMNSFQSNWHRKEWKIASKDSIGWTTTLWPRQRFKFWQFGLWSGICLEVTLPKLKLHQMRPNAVLHWGIPETDMSCQIPTFMPSDYELTRVFPQFLFQRFSPENHIYVFIGSSLTPEYAFYTEEYRETHPEIIAVNIPLSSPIRPPSHSDLVDSEEHIVEHFDRFLNRECLLVGL